MRDFRHGKIFLSGRGSERNCGLDVFRLQRGKISENFLGSIASGQAGKNGAKQDAGTIEDGFATTGLRISNDSVFVDFFVAALVSHGASPSLGRLIISCALPLLIAMPLLPT